MRNHSPSSPPLLSATYRRRFTSLLIDRRLQLRYIGVLVLASLAIAGGLGYLIYQQEQAASIAVAHALVFLGNPALVADTASKYAQQDGRIILMVAGMAGALMLLLSAMLLLMTHKVFGPLHKIAHYFERMATGRLGTITPLRRGDLLRDFYTTFATMHGALAARVLQDAGDAKAACAKLHGVGARQAAVGDAIRVLEAHLQRRMAAIE